MKKLLFLILPFFLFGCSQTPQPEQPPQVSDSIVLVTCYFAKDNMKGLTFGTAFAITKDGLFATAAHTLVQKGATRDRCTVGGETVEIVWEPSDEAYSDSFGLDVAFLRIEGKFAPLPLSKAPEDIQTVIARGYVVNNRDAMTGDLKYKGTFNDRSVEYLFYTDRENRDRNGMSGSPVFVGNEVVGLLTQQNREQNVVAVLPVKAFSDIAGSLK